MNKIKIDGEIIECDKIEVQDEFGDWISLTNALNDAFDKGEDWILDQLKEVKKFRSTLPHWNY